MAGNRIIDLLKVWGDKERAEFIEYCQAAVENFQNTSLAFGDKKTDLNYVLHDVCRQCMLGNLSAESVVAALSEIIPLHKELPSLIADILVILDTESQCSESHTSRERYFNLLRCCNNKIVPEFVLKERLEFETLGEAGIMKLLRNTQTKFIKTKTRLFYKQQKFNLYREEIEGYAKLITELDPDPGQEPDVKYMLEKLQSLIGCFNLDPNRVLDVILESFERKPHLSDFFTPLLQTYFSTSDTISQVIGFKFGFYQQGDVKETPLSLYRVTAFLLKSEVMSLDQLYSLLRPDDSKIIEEHNQELANANLYVKQLNSLSTNTAEANKDAPKNDGNKLETEDNQKLGLFAALLDVGDWNHAQHLIHCFPANYAISRVFIAKKLCLLIHVLIDDFYKNIVSFIPEIKESEKLELQYGVKVKRIETFTELFAEVFPMVMELGPYLHTDPVLMAKIIRLSKQWMSTKGSFTEHGMTILSEIIVQTLLPSLSLLECNYCMAEELWSLLKLFPYQCRYLFYFNWKTNANVMHPALIKTKADILKRLKYIMKRLSRENVKSSGKQIGKLSHSNPGYMFDYILSQIQSWDNLIMPVVDSLKYLTSLSYDVLASCLIEALGNSEKDRMNHDGTGISPWLQRLANFGGALCKKYPIEISGLLQHVADKLISGESLDLLILKEIIQKMAGIEALGEMTSVQLEAMTGGELLKSEGGYFSQQRNVKKSSQRLKKALLGQDLAIPLCLLMAQQKNCIIFQEQENSHIKLVGKLYDQCQDTLVQYGNFLANSFSKEDYASRLPPVSVLLSEYSILADVAFFLHRPALNHAINSQLEELRKQDKEMKNLSNPETDEKYIEVVDSVISPIVLSFMSNQPHENMWETINPQFYVTFWFLSMYDIVVPTNSYEREINKLKTVLQNEDNAGKKKKEREKCDALITKLLEEEKTQQEHCMKVMARLKYGKDDWFKSKPAKNETLAQFLQLCLFPRCIFAAVDALYCAKFVYIIHWLKTPNFSTLLCYDRVFLDIAIAVAACSENEANCYGIMLCSMLETLMRWHSDKIIFDKECASFPGFMTKFKLGKESVVDHVDYENYRHVCHKWHFQLTKSLLKCLDSGDYVQIRNSLLVLRKIAPHFPVIVNLGMALERRIEKIKTDEKEKRPDLFVLATGYSGVLKSKKRSLIQEGEFHLKETRQHNVGAVPAKLGTTVKLEKHDEENETSKEGDGKVEIKNDPVKTETNLVEIQISSQCNSQESEKIPRNEKEQNGMESQRAGVAIVNEESIPESSSSMRCEEKSNFKSDLSKAINARDENRDYIAIQHEKSQSDSSDDSENSDSLRGSHSHFRSLGFADHKEQIRWQIEGSSSRWPRELTDIDSCFVDRSKNDDRNSCEKASETKKYKEVEVEKPKKRKEKRKKMKKNKKKKMNRKREYPYDDSSEPKRKLPKTDDDDDSDSVVWVVKEI